ncbi:bifunctional 4-hydroxy-2-oxoglutarate aldolase/2-dehydro-3-deoxy-phosphogluconate aldolase [Bradyrhizobium ontarionense]|uniref:2-dehydro-3-deoxy-phosphogluconate aldolase n=2 Tax=Bradyrhizobium ontarionense TaxID=2898149 RepID=A0ABY3RKX0_9BRAD|nr:bifunctional 4-hydroxy-2-oxoglutarate aldolase/2-dehydro-3-deoxy-phosphogluconate aldolase [Bradyrhizobium sp. A19]
MSIPDKRAKLDAVFALAPVIPVITIEDAAHAVPLARALVAGGLRVIEITLRTQAGFDAARAILDQVPDAVVGIGTVLTPADYERAAKLGAAFAISPGLSIELLDAATAGELPFAPGIQTSSDLIACVTRGYELVKFFPAVPAGGLPALDALAGPFPNVRFCPTGGINAGNAAQWLQHRKVVAIGGSWVAPAADIKAGAWAAIEQRAREATTLR